MVRQWFTGDTQFVTDDATKVTIQADNIYPNLWDIAPAALTSDAEVHRATLLAAGCSCVAPLAASGLRFFLLYLGGGDIARNDPRARAPTGSVAAKAAQLGPDRPLLTQYATGSASAPRRLRRLLVHRQPVTGQSLAGWR